MPYWDKRGVWQGIVRWQGRKFKKAFKIKRDAVAWEVQTRRDLEEQEIQQTATTTTVMDFLSFSNSYLDDAKLRFTKKTYREKKTLCETLLGLWGNPTLQEITSEMISQYLEETGSNEVSELL